MDEVRNADRTVRVSRVAPGERPRLLFLCQTLPYPPDGGVEIRTYNVMKLLAAAFDVTALCFYRAATRGSRQQVENGISGLAEFAHVEAFPIPHEYSRLRLLKDHARSVVSRRAYTYFTYQSDEFRSRLRDLQAERRFDLAHVDSLDLSAYLPLLEGIPVICTHQNIESDLLRRRAPTESSALMRRYVRMQAELTAAEERLWSGRVDLNVVVSQDDARRLREMVPDARVTVVPNGVDTSAFKPFATEGAGLAFVGGYGWYPNRDAMEYFCEAVLPLVRERAGDVQITWVGRAPEAVVKRYEREYGVRLTGYVDDIRPYVQDAACFIVPLRVGGGSRLKVLDAWAMGKAVVSTSIGCEGLATRDGENIIIRDTPDGMADAIVAVMKDEKLRRTVGTGARATAEQQYDWQVLGDHLISQYNAVLGGVTPSND